MKTVDCPNCNKPLLGTAQHCPDCGKSLTSPEIYLPTHQDTALQTIDSTPERSAVFKLPHIFSLHGRRQSSGNSANHQFDQPVTAGTWKRTRPAFITSSLIQEGPLSEQQMWEDHNEEALPERQATWQKVVETPFTHSPASYPPRPRRPPQSHPLLRLIPYSRRIPPAVLFWISMLVLTLFVGGGIFGIASSWGQNFLHSASANGHLSLHITPNSVAIGATLTLRGANFSPSGHVGLTRDASIPIIDTGGSLIISADKQGKFTDTVVVEADWGNGSHSINAEDAFTHKTISYPLIITGTGAALRPAHLKLSTSTLDLGTDDQAMNTTKQVTLSNSGDGQIAWQGSTSQSWLLISPTTGTFVSHTHTQIAVAADRSNLKPGSYTAEVFFSSNVGDIVLPVSMQVQALPPAQKAILQLSPAILAFNGTDGGPAPASQKVTVSNPGVLPLPLKVTTDSAWLSALPGSATIQPGKNVAVTVKVDTSSLLPGTYNGSIQFMGQNGALHSPQSIYVSVTIVPHCSLTITPGILTFASAYQQAAPASKTISLAGTPSCSAPLQWDATSTANWLTVSNGHGTTPGATTIGINSAGLQPGVYNATVTFSSSDGIHVLLITFTLGQPTEPIPALAASTLTFSAIAGQASPGSLPARLTNTGGGTLSWQAAVTTSIGGSWLSVTPASGSLNANQAVSLNVNSILLSDLTPGTYTGTISITGTDDAGNSATGSPQMLPITFVVKPACTMVATTGNLTFVGTLGQSGPAAQTVKLAVSGTCPNALTWTTQVATTPANGSWLSVTPTSATASLSSAGTASVNVALAGLATGPHMGSVTFSAVDSVTHAAVGTPQIVNVSLTTNPPCALQAPSVTQEDLSAEVGSNPVPQTFSVGVNNTCTGNVTITPTTGTTWLSVTPTSATATPGTPATFTLSVDAVTANLAAGPHLDKISLAASDAGNPTASSPQVVNVTVTMATPPVLTTTPPDAGTITFNTTGVASQAITIGNAGSLPLNWIATLSRGTPAFISLSATAGNNLAGGSTSLLTVSVDTTNVAAGTYTANVIISSIDPTTGNSTSGSPASIQIVINVAPAAMVINTTSLTFSTPAGLDPAPQSIAIQNTGSDTLSWTASSPSASWLSVSPGSGSDTAGTTSMVTFSVDTTGLVAGTPYPAAQVLITPSVGPAVTITISLTVVSGATTPTATATSTATATPTTVPQPTPPGNQETPTPVVLTDAVLPETNQQIVRKNSVPA